MVQTQDQAQVAALGVGRPSNAVYGSDLMVEVLRELEIPYIALNPGASYRGLHDSIVNFGQGPSPEIILCPHEEIAVAIANGYAKATGRPMATGLHDVVGLQHAAMSIFVAWCDRTPIINLGGGGPQDASHRRSTDWVHTALVQGNMVRDFVKYDDQPYSVEAVPESLLRAYRIATTEPKGPVYICLDSDVQEQRITTPMTVPDVSLFKAAAPPGPNLDVLRQAAEMLVRAQWPVIVAGEMGRDPDAVRGLRELAELLGAPVIDAGGPFNFPNTHPLDLTEAREETLRDADVILALDVPNLGVPLGPTVREREALKLSIRADTPIIHITLHDLERQSWVTDVMWLMPVAVPISAGVAQSLVELIEMCRKGLEADSGGKRRVEERKVRAEAIHNKAREQADAWIARVWNEKPLSSPRVNGEIRDRVKGQPWALVGAHGARWRQVLEVTEPGHGIGGGRGGGVGSGLPIAIGAALGFKGSGRFCVNVLGDGDFFMTSNSLWVAAKYDIPLLTVVYNNRSYYNDEEHQERMAVRRDRPVENKGIGILITEPDPDFAGLSRSLGVEAFGPITEPDQLGPALDQAFKIVREGRPAVVDVHTQVR
jgi:thiamine pyrophosphate-dependent acetolactate synthase large subunit-like protein